MKFIIDNIWNLKRKGGEGKLDPIFYLMKILLITKSLLNALPKLFLIDRITRSKALCYSFQIN